MPNQKPERDRRPAQPHKTRSNGQTAWADSLHLGVLVSFAVAQPVFDLLARQAEFFAARRAAPIDIVLLVGCLSLALPALLIGAEGLSGWCWHRLRAGLHTLLVAGLSSLISLHALNMLNTWAGPNGLPGLLLVLSALGLGGTAAVSYRRYAPVRQFVTLLTPAMLIFPGLFVLASPVTSLLFPPTASRLGPVAIPAPAPIIMLVFDEFPLTALLDEQQQIDPVRYPHFATLAREATWFRNATTVSDDTLLVVSAMLTGQYPSRLSLSRLPTAADYPYNLFTVLGDTYAFNVHEARTQLCPERLCGSGVLKRPRLGKRLSGLLSDVSIVYAHLVLPADWRSSLPSISKDWMNFATPSSSGASRSSGAPTKPSKTDRTGADNQAKLVHWVRQDIYLDRAQDRPQRVLDFIATLQPTPQPTLHFLHVLLPHTPYLWLPSGKAYTRGADLPGLDVQGVHWGTDEWAVRQAQQRALLQVGLVDSLLGKLLAQLKANGLYQRSLLVVTADHGVSFVPGTPRRSVTPTNFPDIMSVPLFIKAPGQQAGHINDRAVETVDIIPTVADLLGIALPWATDGQSALDPAVPERPTHSIYPSCASCSSVDASTQRLEFSHIPAALTAAVQRKLRLFGSGPFSPRVFQVGPAPQLVGQQVQDLEVRPRSPIRITLDSPHLFSQVDLEDTFVPAYITGKVFFPTPDAAPVALAVALNGTIQAVTQPWNLLKNGRLRSWAAVVPEAAFQAGPNTVEVFVVSDNAGQTSLARATELSYRLVGSPTDQTEVLVPPDGAPIPIVPQTLRGAVEPPRVSTDTILLKGWAVDETHAQPAEQILIFLNGTFFYAGHTGTPRPDIVKWLGQPVFATSGFYYAFPATLFSGTPDVRVFAVASNTTASELRYVEGYPW